MVWKPAIDFAIELLNLAAQIPEKRPCSAPCRSIAGIDHYPHLLMEPYVFLYIVLIGPNDLNLGKGPLSCGKFPFFNQSSQILDLLAKDGGVPNRYFKSVKF